MMGSLTTEERRRLAERHPELFVQRPTKANPLGGYPIDTPGRARAAIGRAHTFGGPALEARARAKVHARYPEMKLHYHGVHPCRGGDEHARLLGEEGPRGEGLGEAFGLRGGAYGLASDVVGHVMHHEEGAV